MFEEKNVFELEREHKQKQAELVKEIELQEDIEKTHAEWEKLSVNQRLLAVASNGDITQVSNLLDKGLSVNCRG